jgi:Lon protease-like protein
MPDDLDLRNFDGRTRLFPLGGVVMFPHVVFPLHIFEPRYRQMTEDALRGDQLITIIQTRPTAKNDPSDPREPELAEVGCLGNIIRHVRLPDGCFNFLLLGKARVRILRELPASTLYRQAQVEILPDVDSPSDPGPRAEELLARFHALYLGKIDPDLMSLLGQPLELGPLTDLLAHILQLDPHSKQVLLETTDVGRRCDVLDALLKQLLQGKGPQRPSPPPFSLN